MDQRRMCPHCRAFITTRDRICPYCNEKVGARAIDLRNPGDILGGLIPHARFTTAMILTINIGLYLVTVLFSGRHGNDNAFFNLDTGTLILFGASYRSFNFAGQWWRLVTAGFLHGGLLHIGMNSWVLFDLGAEVEQIYGAARLVVFYLLSTVTGFLLSSWWQPGPSMGASAGIFGLIGVMIALGVGHRTSMGAAIRGHYLRWAVYGLLFGMLPGLRIDNAAHIGGLAGGFGIAWLAGLPRLRPEIEKVWYVIALVCVLLAAFCFVEMYLWFGRVAQMMR